MKRLAAALIPTALILFGCAPVPTKQAPAVEPAPASSAQAEPEDPTPHEPSEADTDETSQSTDPSSETTEPAERAREAESQPAEQATEKARSEPEPAPQAQPKPATETPRADAVDDRAVTLSGRITLVGGDADPTEAVVYFIPQAANGTSGREEPSETLEIVTRDKSLSPTVLAVSRGSEVRFPNEDPILHNLFSVSPGNDFDLGVYGPGESPSVSFEQPGVVNIYCNVHHDMHAHVLVVDTPWRAQSDADGNFRLTGLPPGKGELHIWHRQSDRWSRPIELPANAALEATLEVTRPRLPPHRDKTGQPYNRRDRDPYR
jgi:plastocyanin